VILVPFRNVATYISDCLESILCQQYPYFEIHLLDDDSTDNSLELIPDDLKSVFKFKNTRRLGALGSLYEHLIKMKLNEEDIVIILDGDDSLFGEYALQIVNLKYNSDILLTYGQYVDNYGCLGHCSPYSLEEFNSIRISPWKASHLKTFKFKLFQEYLLQDPTGGHFRDSAGKYLMSTYDIALMIPLMEIAGFDKIRFISNILYCYRLHSNNDHSTLEGRQLQKDIEEYIRTNLSPLKQMF